MTIIWRQPPRIISDDRLIGSPVRQTDRQVTRQTLSKIGKNYMKGGFMMMEKLKDHHQFQHQHDNKPQE